MPDPNKAPGFAGHDPQVLQPVAPPVPASPAPLPEEARQRLCSLLKSTLALELSTPASTQGLKTRDKVAMARSLGPYINL